MSSINPNAPAGADIDPGRVEIDKNAPWALGKVWSSTKREEPPKIIETAACLIIGDEVLSGKTIDTNSGTFAKWCFSLGVDLKRIETISDDESDIMEAVRRMSSKYDFIVTSGGIGPTHDDITYPSIAKAFNLPLRYHAPTISRMKPWYATQPQKRGPTPLSAWENPTPDLISRLIMTTLPTPDPPNNPTPVDYVFAVPNSWVPIVVVNKNIHILPGIPNIFQDCLESLTPVLIEQGRIDLESRAIHRILISSPLRESIVAGYLTKLQAEADKRQVKVGSYPRWGKKRNTITMTGRDKEWMESVLPEVCKNLEGVVVQVEGEDDTDAEYENDEDTEAGTKKTGIDEKVEKLDKARQTMEVNEVKEGENKGRESKLS